MSMVEDFICLTHHNLSRDNFTSQLFKLIFKADRENLNQLEKGFPSELELFYWWRGSPQQPTDEMVREFGAQFNLTPDQYGQTELNLDKK